MKSYNGPLAGIPQPKDSSRLNKYKKNNSIISQSGRNAMGMNGLSIVTNVRESSNERSLPQINSMKNIRDLDGNLTSSNKNNAASSLKGGHHGQ